MLSPYFICSGLAQNNQQTTTWTKDDQCDMTCISIARTEWVKSFEITAISSRWQGIKVPFQYDNTFSRYFNFIVRLSCIYNEKSSAVMALPKPMKNLLPTEVQALIINEAWTRIYIYIEVCRYNSAS